MELTSYNFAAIIQGQTLHLAAAAVLVIAAAAGKYFLTR